MIVKLIYSVVGKLAVFVDLILYSIVLPSSAKAQLQPNWAEA